MNCNRILRLLFAFSISFFLITCQSSSPVSNAQTDTQSPSSAGNSGADCAKEPFTYDNGPLGQSHWCGACNLAISKLQAPININTKDTQIYTSFPTTNFSGYKATNLLPTANLPH